MSPPEQTRVEPVVGRNTEGRPTDKPAASSESSVSVPKEQQAIEVLTELADDICREVAELPDRNSPEDWPEAMLVTHDELRRIVLEVLSAGSENSMPPLPLPLRHVCGLQGYNGMIDPPCPACEANRSLVQPKGQQ